MPTVLVCWNNVAMAQHGHGHLGRYIRQLFMRQRRRTDGVIVGNQQEKAKLLYHSRAAAAG